MDDDGISVSLTNITYSTKFTLYRLYLHPNLIKMENNKSYMILGEKLIALGFVILHYLQMLFIDFLSYSLALIL